MPLGSTPKQSCRSLTNSRSLKEGTLLSVCPYNYNRARIAPKPGSKKSHSPTAHRPSEKRSTLGRRRRGDGKEKASEGTEGIEYVPSRAFRSVSRKVQLLLCARDDIRSSDIHGRCLLYTGIVRYELRVLLQAHPLIYMPERGRFRLQITW